MLLEVEKIASAYKGRNDMLIKVLREVQPLTNNTLTPEVAKTIANAMEIPLTQVYDTATFYALFSTEPRGKHIIRLCRSASCHLNKAKELLQQIEKKLNIKVGQTTTDGLFTLETCECLGLCDVSPSMIIDDDVYGNVTINKFKKIIGKYR